MASLSSGTIATVRKAIRLAFGILLALTVPLQAVESVWVYTVQISADVQTSPARITLRWPQDQYGANSYTVYRKAAGATSWGSGTALPGSATSYVDSNVAVGSTYEYQIVKAASQGYTGYGYIYAGINAPLIENRGKVILLVDNTHAAQLTGELARLQGDLVGDGWTVVRHDVSRNDTPASVKNVIRAAYNADPSNVKAVFLFGHVPIFRSGNLNVDGHQSRPMPADGYYGDMDGAWDNPSYLPSDVELMLGRVDLFNMPGSGSASPWPSEVELLRRYLNKDHNFRHKLINPPRRALVGDRFGDGPVRGEAFAASAYRNFEPFVGPGHIVWANEQDNAPGDQKWTSKLAAGTYLWSYGCGGGSYTSMSGLGTHGQYSDAWSIDIVDGDAKAIFFMMFGSWLGEWDSRDNIMRAALAAPGMGLTCSWAGRPHWYYHHMGLGEPIGYSARLSQNNSDLYRNQINSFTRGVHIALMGDPTLRMHAVAPVSGAIAAANSGTVNLSWTASPDSVQGYHVYRASDANGPFARLTSSLLTGNSFSDSTAGAGNHTYMIRAVKLESTPSGTYFNPSQGIFVTTGSGGADNTAPAVSVAAPLNNATVSGAAVTVSANASDNVGVAGVQFKLDGANLGTEDTSAPYSIVWNTTQSAGLHLLTAVARDAAGNRATSAAVTVLVTDLPDATVIWVDDAVPAGATSDGEGGDSWNWITSSPAPFSGAQGHQSNLGTGMHQHFFNYATATLPVNTGDTLFAYVYLDPANVPDQLMLQWTDGSWDHRAYWGANIMTFGADGTASRRYIGPLPAAGQWARLEVPASSVGLEGRTLKGMAFTLYRGRATWDAAGKSALLGSAPIAASLRMTTNGPLVSWSSDVGRTYRIEYKNDLSAAVWTAVGQTVTAVSATSSWVDTTASSAPHRFYRIREVP